MAARTRNVPPRTGPPSGKLARKCKWLLFGGGDAIGAKPGQGFFPTRAGRRGGPDEEVMGNGPTQGLSARCAVVGGGPAGMMLGLLLARAGIEVVVLEKHATGP